MSPSAKLRIVLVGRDLPIRPLEDTLTQEGAGNYICVPSFDAADWLIRDGFDADVLVVHDALLPRPADLAALRDRYPQAIVLPASASCPAREIRSALAAATRRREERLEPKRAPSFLESFGRRLAWS